MRIIDCTGMKFNKLTAVSRVPAKGRTLWRCVCECGKESVVEGYALRSGGIKSCGCIMHTKWEGYEKTKSKRLYGVWLSMRRRCDNKNVRAYARYGGRGIKVCSEWQEFSVFEKWANENGYKQGLSLDRANNNGDYCPENCRFVSMKEQNRNRSDNVYIRHNGRDVIAADLAVIADVSSSTISKWIKSGVIHQKLRDGKSRRYYKDRKVPMQCLTESKES